MRATRCIFCPFVMFPIPRRDRAGAVGYIGGGPRELERTVAGATLSYDTIADISDGINLHRGSTCGFVLSTDQSGVEPLFGTFNRMPARPRPRR